MNRLLIITIVLMCALTATGCSLGDGDPYSTTGPKCRVEQGNTELRVSIYGRDSMNESELREGYTLDCQKILEEAKNG